MKIHPKTTIEFKIQSTQFIGGFFATYLNFLFKSDLGILVGKGENTGKGYKLVKLQ